MMINLVTVCTDAYPLVYAEKLHRQFDKITKLDVSHWCITDRPADLYGLAKPITPFKKSIGWWNKVNVYSPQMPKGHVLYMDLDIIILQNFDEEIIEMTARQEDMCCVSDAIGWMGVKFSSSLMCFESGVHSKIFREFVKNEDQIKNLEGGDQVWTGPQLNSTCYIDDYFPNLKKNLKYHVARRNNDKVTMPKVLDKEIKLLDCGGRPKPHELERLPYVKKNWHDV